MIFKKIIIITCLFCNTVMYDDSMILINLRAIISVFKKRIKEKMQ